ncbi:hypothetical protein [Polymorphobacter sp.]|uniref:hypothetical protein n=1 Tax=Polymorphobacter sp. TaxID=1909290 RepID=UPI003F6F402A
MNHGPARFCALALLVVLAGCASTEKGGWPSLAPRANEVSPLVPRVPLGACAGCAPDAAVTFTTPPPLLGVPEPLPLPADAADRLTALEAAIADVEKRWPGQRRDALAAIRAASADNDTERDTQASRFEALFLTLGETSAALEELEDGLADRPDEAALAARALDLRLRLDRLEAVRVAGLD